MNDFEEIFILQLNYLSQDEKRLMRACTFLKDKIVIEDSKPFNVRLIGKIIEKQEAAEYTKNCTLRNAEEKFIHTLLDLDNNKTNYIRCEYNDVINSFIQSDYVKNFFLRIFGISDNNFNFTEMTEDELFYIMDKIKDPYKFKMLRLYLGKLELEEIKDLIKK